MKIWLETKILILGYGEIWKAGESKSLLEQLQKLLLRVISTKIHPGWLQVAGTDNKQRFGNSLNCTVSTYSNLLNHPGHCSWGRSFLYSSLSGNFSEEYENKFIQ